MDKNYEMHQKVEEDPGSWEHAESKTEINVIDKDAFESHVNEVSYLLWKTLSKSFGPYGSNTIIHKHPYSHITKDGFTIAKSISFNVAETFTNQAISTMITDICGRMNTAVGDGTTTAIVSTYNIYHAYLMIRDYFHTHGYMPRDILYRSSLLKEKIRERLQSKAIQIGVSSESDKEEADITVENIRKVVSISSNGDDKITDTITELYRKFGFPMITCEKSVDGEERVVNVEGFRLQLHITDQMYVNSDEGIMQLGEADVLVFTCKITNDIYEHIIQPTLLLSQACGRKLLVAAPSYDEILLDRTIAPMLRNEYGKYKTISLVICAYKATSAYQKKTISDFAMLCRTTPIDRALASAIIGETVPLGSESQEKPPFYGIINTRRTWLSDISFPFIDIAAQKMGYASHSTNEERLLDTLKERGAYVPGEEVDHKLYFNLGYCRDLELGLDKPSIIHKFFYDEDEYHLHLEEAKKDMENAENKYKRLGTFNTETTKARQRYYALQLQIALIEVGGESELSIGMRRDIYDDAIKAAASAYRHGTILGCNVSTIKVIEEVWDALKEPDTEEEDVPKAYDAKLLSIFHQGFVDTYRTVLNNWHPDEVACTIEPPKKEDGTEAKLVCDDEDCQNIATYAINRLQEYIPGFSENAIFQSETGKKAARDAIERICEMRLTDQGPLQITLYDFLIEFSVQTETVFDLTTKQFSKDVINSLQTDDEVLTATIDLLTLLISGNQMVVTQRLSFED